jgi:hypothetical protein
MSTREYIHTLTQLKPGELGLLRTYAGQGIDGSTQGFDLFAGLWWPLRSKNQRAPRREVAWLIAKLYAYHPLPQLDGEMLAALLSIYQPRNEPERDRFQKCFDRMLMQPLVNVEEPLRWALDQIYIKRKGVDWIKLTDDLSLWEREETRLGWAKQFLSKI